MSDTERAPELLITPATVHGRTLVLPPRDGPPRRWLVGYHGYGQSAAIMLELLRPIPRADRWLLVAVQALHPFYSRADEVIASWMTREDREHAIADNVAYVDAVLGALEREHGRPQAVLHAGFSQGVEMAYRASLLGRRRGDAVLAVAGDLPPELKSGGPRTWPPVRIVVGTGETWYTPERRRADVEFLRGAGADVREIVFEGGHEWTGAVIEAANDVLAEIEANVSD